MRRGQLLALLDEQLAADLEARQAVMGLTVRIVDEIRFGLRDIDVDELQTLACTWSSLNDGATPAEIALRHLEGTS